MLRDPELLLQSSGSACPGKEDVDCVLTMPLHNRSRSRSPVRAASRSPSRSPSRR
jgi:hypothetical protein